MKTLAGVVLMLVLSAHATATPLHDAAEEGNTAAIIDLLDAGADPNAKD